MPLIAARSPRRRGVAGIAVLVLFGGLLAGCQIASVGARCSGRQFATDHHNVLVCRGGRWRAAMTVAAFIRLMAAIQAANAHVPEPDGPVVVSHLVVTNGSRVLPTTVYAPPGPGPFPLVAFAHGWNSSPAKYDRLLHGWAAAGFEVVAPESPGMAQNLAPLSIASRIYQPGDLSACITAMLSTGTVDATRIAIAGHSDGGSTVAAMALTTRYRDPRASVYVSLSGGVGGLPGSYGPINNGPILVMVGDQDEFGNWPGTERVYDTAAAPKAFVAIHGGRHIDPFIDDTGQASAVRVAIIDFLRASFGHTDWSALDSVTGGHGLELSTTGAPPLTPPTTAMPPTTAPPTTAPLATTTTTTTTTTASATTTTV